MTPPTPIRRPLTITTWLIASTICLILSPLLLAIGALVSSVMRRPQPLLLARLVIAYFGRELTVLLACGLLWLVSGCGWKMRSGPFRSAHYRVLRWFVGGVSGRVRELLDIDIEVQPSPEAESALHRDQPVIFFSRHAGPGDTVFITDLLMTRYGRLPSVVFKDVLTVDPCIDLLGHRLPHAVLDQSNAQECEARIEQAAAMLAPRGALLLFPEGGNITAKRRRRSIDKLWRKGRRREAAAGERMEHVMTPHPTGALAALRGNPKADIIFSAHTGLGLAAFPAQLWRNTPFHRTLRTKMWRVAASERPADPAEQIRWLYESWERMDRWLESQGEEHPAELERER
jgi:1-acyl-sn-glycerol-3-phosphate acyltransferase